MSDQQQRRPSGPTFRFVQNQNRTGGEQRSSPNSNLQRANSPQIHQPDPMLQQGPGGGLHHSASMPVVHSQGGGPISGVRPMLVTTQPIQPPHHQIIIQQGGPGPGQPRHLQPMGPPPQGRAPVNASPVAPPNAPARPPSHEQTGDPDPVNKCIRFFRTLISLSTSNRSNDDPATVHENTLRVKALIRNVIYDSMPVEMFTARLQDVLKSTTQPHLLPFLQKTLPVVREGVRRGDIHIEGVSPPPAHGGNNEPMQMPPRPGMGPPPHIANFVQPQGNTYQPPISLQHPITRQQITRIPQSVSGPSAAGPGPDQMALPPTQLQPPVARNQRSRSPKVAGVQKSDVLDDIVASVAAGGRNSSSVVQHATQPLAPQPPAAPPPQPQVQQKETVQMSQQSNQQQAQGMPSSSQPQDEDTLQVRSYQEPLLKYTLLNADEVMRRITKRMTEPCFLEEEMLILLSDVCESRLREMLGELATLAEHRLDPLRLNPNYQQVDDTKRQLKILEEIDRQREEQRENREKESLYKMSKSKGVDKNIAEKAKEMQRADAEAKRNREANEAAIAALGKANKPKWEQAMSGTQSTTTYRPRTVRANLRDLQALMLNDPRYGRSQMLHKLTLMGPPTSDTL